MKVAFDYGAYSMAILTEGAQVENVEIDGRQVRIVVLPSRNGWKYQITAVFFTKYEADRPLSVISECASADELVTAREIFQTVTFEKIATSH